MKAALLDGENKITNIILIDKLTDVPNCYFISDISTLKIGDVYAKELAEMGYKPNSKHPFVQLTDVTVTGENVMLGGGSIWWLPKNSTFTLTANAQLPDSEMMVIIERVINGGTVIDDLRVKATIVGGVITVNGEFAMSGNYQITSDRLNKGLETIGASFRLAFDKVEFDAHV